MSAKNKLWPADEKLFAVMGEDYQSENEATIFRNLKHKQESEVALSNELLVSERENQDQVYLVRVEYDEYIVGVGPSEKNEVHVMNLSEALTVNLEVLGLPRIMTLLEWLRTRDYEGVRYDRNYDKV